MRMKLKKIYIKFQDFCSSVHAVDVIMLHSWMYYSHRQVQVTAALTTVLLAIAWWKKAKFYFREQLGVSFLAIYHMASNRRSF
jgi:hypothetical protein